MLETRPLNDTQSALNDTQSETLAAWIREFRPGGDPPAPLPGDLSARRYYRSDGEPPLVLARYPPHQLPVLERFLETTRLLQDADVTVPRVLHADRSRGLVALEDVGTENLYEWAIRSGCDPGPWIEAAAAWLPRIRNLDRDTVAELQSPMDAGVLRSELAECQSICLEPMNLALDGADLDRALDDLCLELGAAPQIPCHRDLMARNLMVPDSSVRRLVLIDHQDLRLGPPQYDLASLLNDSLPANDELEARLLSRLTSSRSERTGYHRAVVQRCLKAAATFLRFADRGHSQHLGLVQPSLSRVWRSFGEVPELEFLRPRLRDTWERYLGTTLPPGASVDWDRPRG